MRNSAAVAARALERVQDAWNRRSSRATRGTNTQSLVHRFELLLVGTIRALHIIGAALSTSVRAPLERVRRVWTRRDTGLAASTVIDHANRAGVSPLEDHQAPARAPSAARPWARITKASLGAHPVAPGQELRLAPHAVPARALKARPTAVSAVDHVRVGSDAGELGVRIRRRLGGRLAHLFDAQPDPAALLTRSIGLIVALATRLRLVSADGAAGAPGSRTAGSPISSVVGRDRWLAVGLGVLVLVASVVSVAPPRPANGGTGNTYAAGTAPRISINALDGAAIQNGAAQGPTGIAGEGTQPTGFTEVVQVGETLASGQSIEGPASLQSTAPGPQLAARFEAGQVPGDAAIGGPFLADGTLLKPLAVDTTVPDASAILKRVKVRSGDTLATIAKRYGVSPRSVWSSNYSLKSPTAIHAGMTLLVPPVNGEVHIVASGETIQDISDRTGAPISRIMSVNRLNDQTLFIGQLLVIPGAADRPYPKPVVASSTTSDNASPTVTSAPATPRAPVQYSGGRMTWPVPGGFISQYFHYGHWAIDIAGTYGIPVIAAAAGVVTFAGWKNNGGGYQVWMSHGNNIYTTYNHMSAVTVGVGQYLSAGEQVGRLGMTGDATGPHCHFEVWIGPIWDGGTRVNPLNYF